MKFAGMEVKLDPSLGENEVRIGYPPRYEVWTRPGGEVLDCRSFRAGDKFVTRLDWGPPILAARIVKD